jgi:ComF family protein
MEWRSGLQRWKRPEWANRLPRMIGHAGRRWLSGCTELLFPPVCLMCGGELAARVAPICGSCQEAWLADRSLRCPRCAKPLPQHAIPDVDGCSTCRTKRWRVHRAVTLGTYGGALRDLVLRIKQPRYEPLCLAAGELLARHIQAAPEDAPPDLVAPVPMHWLRRLTRGTNDAELLAEAVAGRLQLPWDARLLHNRRPTRKQGTLLPDQRKRNVRGAYGLRRPTLVAGKQVLIVDDVMTTGATANELAKVLLRAGAERVTVAVIARGVGFD